jgi:hypothetical protein
MLEIYTDCRLQLDNGIVIVIYLLFSLTKYSAIFAEVKGYFGIYKNQLGRFAIDHIYGSFCRNEIGNQL